MSFPRPKLPVAHCTPADTRRNVASYQVQQLSDSTMINLHNDRMIHTSYHTGRSRYHMTPCRVMLLWRISLLWASALQQLYRQRKGANHLGCAFSRWSPTWPLSVYLLPAAVFSVCRATTAAVRCLPCVNPTTARTARPDVHAAKPLILFCPFG